MSDLAVAALLAASICVCFCPTAGADDEVRLSLSVKDHDGNAISRVPLEVHTGRQARFLITNEDGIATTPLLVAPGDHELVVRINDGSNYKVSPEDAHTAHENFVHYTSDYFCKQSYVFPVVPQQGAYDLSVTLEPAVKGTFTITNNGPSFGVVGVRDGASGEVFKPNVPDAIGGIPKGREADLFFFLETPRVMVVTVSAQQTLTDFDLGNLQLNDAVDGSATVDITVMNAEGLLDACRTPLQTAVTLVRDDGQMILVYPIKPGEPWKVVETTETVKPPVPPVISPGAYYIAPGLFGGRPSLVLFDLVRQGKRAVLDAHDVPKLTAIDGQTVQFSLDAARARIAIEAAGGK